MIRATRDSRATWKTQGFGKRWSVRRKACRDTVVRKVGNGDGDDGGHFDVGLPNMKPRCEMLSIRSEK